MSFQFPRSNGLFRAWISAATVALVSGSVSSAQEAAGFGRDLDHPPITIPLPSWATKIEERNAALGYWAAIASQPKELIEAVSEIDWDAVGNEIDPAKLPPAFTKAGELLDDGKWDTTEVLTASRMSRCDFEPKWENGVETLLPHLGSLRRVVRAVRVEARWALAHGDASKASERVAAMFRMAAHATNDRILISSLVGAAISASARQEADALLGSGKLTAPMREALLGAIARVRTDDPFRGREAMETERDIFMAWVVKAMKSGPEGRKNIVALTSSNDSKQKQDLVSMTDAQVDADAAKAKTIYDEVIAVWNAPDAQDRMSQFEKRVEAGEAGLLGKLLLPSFKRANSSIRLEMGKLGELAEKLKGGK